MNTLLHYLTIPLKVTLIFFWSNVHKFVLAVKYYRAYGKASPDLDALRVGYNACKLSLPKELISGPINQPILNTNPDHQCLRNASLVWSYPNQALFDGMESYIVDDTFIRGFESINPLKLCQYAAPAAMPISVAHSLATARQQELGIYPSFRKKFLGAVDKLMANNMAIDHDTSVTPRLKSTGFDAIFALSLLYTAYDYSKDSKYLKEANKILWLKGYILLLLAPFTFLNYEKRNYFIDHLGMVGLRTAYLMCPNPIIRFVLKLSLKFVGSQSYTYGNPYFGALAYECGALPSSQRKRILDLHKGTNVLKAAKFREVVYTTVMPSDYSTHTGDEFIFDEIHSLGLDCGIEKKFVALNGLCLAKSLATLMEKEI